MMAMVGGSIIGLAVSLMLLFNGRVTGISGIIGGILNTNVSDKGWRLAFVLGLLSGGFILRFFAPHTLPAIAFSPLLIVGGLLVGFGTLLGNGCTSGHGVCGISRFSTRSIIATVTFILSGVITVSLMRWLGGIQ